MGPLSKQKWKRFVKKSRGVLAAARAPTHLELPWPLQNDRDFGANPSRRKGGVNPVPERWFHKGKSHPEGGPMRGWAPAHPLMHQLAWEA